MGRGVRPGIRPYGRVNDMRAELKRLAEEAAYSAKGHFKSADWIRVSVKLYVAVPLVTSLIIFVFDVEGILEKCLAFLGALFSGLALTSVVGTRPEKAERAVREHMQLGNEYLDLYKELRAVHEIGEAIDSDRVHALRERMSGLDGKSSKLPIGIVGRYWAKVRIRSEMDLKWLD